MNAGLSNEQNKAAPVTLKPSDTQTHRVSTSLNVVCTVPLRSVSVAWTNRISPDPARTSGPSSFWGKIRTVSEMWRIKRKLMPDRKMERDGWDRRRERGQEWSELEWCSLAQNVACTFPSSACFFFPLWKAPTSPCPAPAPLMTKKKSDLCVIKAPPLQYVFCNSSKRHYRLWIFLPPRSDPSLSAFVNHCCHVAPNLAERRAAFSHICLSDCTTQDKGGGGGVGGGRFLNFSRAVLPT